MELCVRRYSVVHYIRKDLLMSKSNETRSALQSALAKIQALETGKEVDSTKITASNIQAMPVAQIRQGLLTLQRFSSAEELHEARVDFKGILTSMFSWKDPKTTKTLIKCCNAALASTDEDENSNYAQAVEVMSLAAAASPLLQPDRMVRIIEHAMSTPTAFAPVLWPAKFTAQLREVLDKYQEPRREALLMSLWDIAHDGRWWTTLHSGKPKLQRSRRRRDYDAEAREIKTMILSNHPDFAATYDAEQDETFRNLKFVTHDEIRELTLLMQDELVDPDIEIALSAVVGLAPRHRPKSPMPAILAMTNDIHKSLEDMGGAAAFALPKKPKTWQELCPAGDVRPFPIPDHILDCFHKAVLPGFARFKAPNGDEEVAGSWIRLCRNAVELDENATFMGNCTGGYLNRSKEGNAWIARVHVVDTSSFSHPHSDFNVGIGVSGNKVRFTEVNSRHNAGNVPAAVKAGLDTLLAKVNSL